MRTLAFPPGVTHYRLLYQAVVIGPTQIAKADLPSHGRLLDAFESIGIRDPRTEPTKEAPDPVPLYDLQAQGGTIVLEEADFLLLRRMLDDTVPLFHKAKSREVTACVSWLESVEERNADGSQRRRA